MGRRPSNGIAPKRIMNKIDNALKKTVKDYGEIIFKRLANAFDETIDYFYNDYKPHHRKYGWYKGNRYRMRNRQYELYRLLKGNRGGHTPALKDSQFPAITVTDQAVSIRIHISYKNMREDSTKKIHRMDRASVFVRSYIEGKHGFTSKENDQWNKGKQTNYKGEKNEWWMPKSHFVFEGLEHYPWDKEERYKKHKAGNWVPKGNEFIKVPDYKVPTQMDVKTVTSYGEEGGGEGVRHYSNNPRTTHPGLDRILYDKKRKIIKNLKNDGDLVDKLIMKHLFK